MTVTGRLGRGEEPPGQGGGQEYGHGRDTMTVRGRSPQLTAATNL